MTGKKYSLLMKKSQELFGDKKELFKEMLEGLVQEFLENEMDEVLAAEKHERTDKRTGYRSGYYERSLITRVGRIELRVPQDRNGLFSTEIFEKYQRSEKAFLGTLAQMYVQGVSTRKVKRVTEQLCGHSFSASSISRITAKLDEELKRFACRSLEYEYPYLMLDARYEKTRDDGIIRSNAVMVAIGVNPEGKREILAVEMANRESKNSWRDFLLKLKARGLGGVKYVVSDDHEVLKTAIREVLTGSPWQRCFVHFLRNALDYLPRKSGGECLNELKCLYYRNTREEAVRDLEVWLEKWNDVYPGLCGWVEENIEETFTFYSLPKGHRKHMGSTNMLERFNEEIKRRTRVIRVFPDTGSCLRLVRAIAVETHEEWLVRQYLDMKILNDLAQKRKEKKAA
jgi:transposase-like protein